MITNRMKEILLNNHTLNEDINSIINHLLDNGGKMIRPRLVVLTAGMYPHEPATVRDTAVAVELIHMASLVHDDIIDNSLLRRGRDSVNGRWGNQVGVLTGDYLFASAFNLINKHGLQEIMNNITETIQIMCSGEIRQMSMAYDVNISEADYFDKTYRKTACLFASSCKIGALVSYTPENIGDIIEQFGLNLGYAYQIIDDVLDWVSTSELIGKPVGTDLLQGNITLPVIYALQTKYGPWLKSVIQNGQPDNQQMAKIINILLETGALEYSINQSRQYLDRSIELLHCLPEKPILQQLENMAQYIVKDYYYQLRDYNMVPLKEAINHESAGYSYN